MPLLIFGALFVTGLYLPKGHPVTRVVLSGRWACYVTAPVGAARNNGMPTEVQIGN